MDYFGVPPRNDNRFVPQTDSNDRGEACAMAGWHFRCHCEVPQGTAAISFDNERHWIASACPLAMTRVGVPDDVERRAQ